MLKFKTFSILWSKYTRIYLKALLACHHKQALKCVAFYHRTLFCENCSQNLKKAKFLQAKLFYQQNFTMQA